MAIKSELYQGLINAGSTHLSWDGTIEQIGLNQLSIVGLLTLANGQEFTLNQVITLPDGTWRVELGGTPPELKVRSAMMLFPDGWQSLQVLAGFGPGIAVEGGAIVGDVYVLEVVHDAE